MAQVTTNTEINTINILQEAPSLEDGDLFLLQRGSSTFKLKSEKLSVSVNQLKNIDNNRVLGNISGEPASPYGLTLKNNTDTSQFNSDTAVVTEKRIKEYINTQLQASVSTIANGPVFVSPIGREPSNGTWTAYDVQQILGLSSAPSSVIIQQSWATGQSPDSQSLFRVNDVNYRGVTIHSGGGGDIEWNTFQGIIPVQANGQFAYYGYRSDGGYRGFAIIGYFT